MLKEKFFRTEFFVVLIMAGLMNCSDTEMQVELVLDTGSDLGEGAIWNHETGRLYWVDITNEILNIYNPSTGINKEMMTGQMIGTVVPSETGKAIVALRNGIYVMDVSTGSKKLITDPEADIPTNRFNDGKCGPGGRFWAGTMSLEGEPGQGALYRLDGSGVAVKIIENVSVSNGIVWSHGHTKMYYIDTPTRKVMAYDFDKQSGEIGNGEAVVKIPREMGSPDGMAIDADGNLWIALWGGFAVGCWNPESGELIRKIDVPAKNVTSCAFGGPGLGTLYITTARQGMSEQELKDYPHSGGLFKIRPGVKGVPAYFFKGDF